MPDRHENEIHQTVQAERAAADTSTPPALKNAAQKQTVQDIMRHPQPGSEVILEGFIVREINYETVLFDDGTGQIEVVVDDDEHLPDGAIRKGQRILLKGEVKKGLFKKTLYIDFDSGGLLSSLAAPEIDSAEETK